MTRTKKDPDPGKGHAATQGIEPPGPSAPSHPFASMLLVAVILLLLGLAIGSLAGALA
ncbi:MAG: hypothetical protein JNM82_10790 [Rhodocyclaceae bacterium]|nr:hypothetical protein [Rhodocyclaceae bacterium]